MILQAYDFLELNKSKNCIMQVGGSDQWGNIVNGVELIKRHTGKHVFGLTTPLITLASGAKMGKTEEGAIWLDRKLLSAYDYWQFWRNTDDNDVIRFIKMYTDKSINEIENIKNRDINKLKIILANEATAMLHGKTAALNAEKTAKETFIDGIVGKDLPVINLKNKQGNKINILELVLASKLLMSKGEVRRAIKNNGIKINDTTIVDDKLIVDFNQYDKNTCKLSFGKKKHIVVKLI